MILFPIKTALFRKPVRKRSTITHRSNLGRVPFRALPFVVAGIILCSTFFPEIIKNVGRSSAFRPRYPNIYIRTFFIGLSDSLLLTTGLKSPYSELKHFRAEGRDAELHQTLARGGAVGCKFDRFLSPVHGKKIGAVFTGLAESVLTVVYIT